MDLGESLDLSPFDRAELLAQVRKPLRQDARNMDRLLLVRLEHG